jgi:hypothetical protein
VAARKGIRAKVVAWLAANPGVTVTGRELERMYIEHGGSEDRSRPGHISRDTLRDFIRSLPIRRISEGSGRGGKIGRYYLNATWAAQDATAGTVQGP